MDEETAQGMSTTLLIPQSVDGNLQRGPASLMSLLHLDLEELKGDVNAQAVKAEINRYEVVYTSSRTLISAGLYTLDPKGMRKQQSIFVEDGEKLLDTADIVHLMQEFKQVIIATWDYGSNDHCVHELVSALNDGSYDLEGVKGRNVSAPSVMSDMLSRAADLNYSESAYNLAIIQLEDYPELGLLDIIEHIFDAHSLVFLGFTSGYKGYLLRHRMVQKLNIILLPAVIGHAQSERAITGLVEANHGDFSRYIKLRFESVVHYTGGIVSLMYVVENDSE